MAINRPDYNPISRLSHDGELGGTLTKRWAEIEYERRYLSWHRVPLFSAKAHLHELSFLLFIYWNIYLFETHFFSTVAPFC